MRPVQRQLAVLFLLAFAGVLVMAGLVIDAALGRVGVLVYLALLAVPIAVGALSTARRRSRLAAGRTCTCCTGSVHDPVQVI
jgi:hypothetical protein